MRISDWSSDVCSSDLAPFPPVTQPTLVVWGMRDKALLPCQLDGLGTLVPNLDVVEIDAGHFVPWEAPDAVNAAMRDWLAERSEERRVGKECVSTCRSRGSPSH